MFALYDISQSGISSAYEYLHYFVLYLDRELKIHKSGTYLCLYFLDINAFLLGDSMCMPILE